MTDEIDYKPLVHPLLRDLPEFTKNPANFEPIQRALLETLACKKSHSDPSEVFDCKTCTDNMLKRRELMKKFGFHNPAQYMAWKKVHEDIKARMPLDMYNRISGKKNKTI